MGCSRLPISNCTYFNSFLLCRNNGMDCGYFFQSILVGLPENTDQAGELFNLIHNGSRDFIGQIFSLVLALYIVSGGIRKGIEKLNKICMPTLFIILLGLVIWAAFLGNAGEGYRNFLFNFDLSNLAHPTTIRNAFSLAFFSLSLGIGIMITYASYINKKSDLTKQAVQIASLDTSVGLMAGLITFPIIFTFGLNETISKSTIATLFITIPSCLGQYGLIGRLVAILFFGLAS